MGLHVLHNDSRENGDEVTVVIVHEGVVVHLALPSAGCIFCTPAQHGSTVSSGVPIHIDKQLDGNITFEATLLGWLSIARMDGRPVKSSDGRLGTGRHSDKIN